VQARAVIFDLGDVVISSPLHAIVTYEREKIRPLKRGIRADLVLSASTTPPVAR